MTTRARGSTSHTWGGHLADWIFTEMLERTGRKIKYQAVFNYLYKLLWVTMTHNVEIYHARNPENVALWKNIAGHISKDDKIGDIFEIYVAVKCFNGDMVPIMVLMENVFYDYHRYDTHNWKQSDASVKVANQKLALVRTWISGIGGPNPTDPLNLRLLGDTPAPAAGTEVGDRSAGSSTEYRQAHATAAVAAIDAGPQNRVSMYYEAQLARAFSETLYPWQEAKLARESICGNLFAGSPLPVLLALQAQSRGETVSGV